MTLILPIALIEGGALLALAVYGLYQRFLSQMWQEQYGAAFDAKLELMDERNQAQTDLAHAKDEIATLEAERDNARAQRDRLNERCAQLSVQLAERDGRIRQLEHGRDGIVAALGVLNQESPAPVAAGSDGEQQYAVKKPRKRGNGKATGEAVKE